MYLLTEFILPLNFYTFHISLAFYMLKTSTDYDYKTVKQNRDIGFRNSSGNNHWPGSYYNRIRRPFQWKFQAIIRVPLIMFKFSNFVLIITRIKASIKWHKNMRKKGLKNTLLTYRIYSPPLKKNTPKKAWGFFFGNRAHTTKKNS